MTAQAALTAYYHGGPLQTEYFLGATWVSHCVAEAVGYSDRVGDLIYIVLMDLSNEVCVDEDVDRLCQAADNEAGWREQTRQIAAAKAAGATVYCADDGLAVLDLAGRHVFRVTVEQAYEIDDEITWGELDDPLQVIRAVLGNT